MSSRTAVARHGGLGGICRAKKVRYDRQRRPKSHRRGTFPMQATRLLSAREVEDVLLHLRGWSLQGNKLHRQYHFSTFEKALGFLAGLALVAREAEHPLEESEIYNNVNVDVTTPELGGISPIDVMLAEKADIMADSLQAF